LEGAGVVLEALMETVLCIAEVEVAGVDEVHELLMGVKIYTI